MVSQLSRNQFDSWPIDQLTSLLITQLIDGITWVMLCSTAVAMEQHPFHVKSQRQTTSAMLRSTYNNQEKILHHDQPRFTSSNQATKNLSGVPWVPILEHIHRVHPSGSNSRWYMASHANNIDRDPVSFSPQYPLFTSQNDQNWSLLGNSSIPLAYPYDPFIVGNKCSWSQLPASKISFRRSLASPPMVWSSWAFPAWQQEWSDRWEWWRMVDVGNGWEWSNMVRSINQLYKHG